MPPTWVFRKTVDGERIGEPRPCAINNELAHAVGALTVDEQTALLLATDENVAELHNGQRKIFRGDQLVGYIVVLSTE